MLEIKGNIWDYHAQGDPIVITTNGDINSRGECVMGRGVALQARNLHRDLPRIVAAHIRANGNAVGWHDKYCIFTLPVKWHWKQDADPALIHMSCKNLVKMVSQMGMDRVYMVRPGCCNGHLMWQDIKPLIEPILDDRFTIVQL